MNCEKIEKLYWDQGFVIIENFFSKNEVNLMKYDFDNILDQARQFETTSEYKKSVFVLDSNHSSEFPIIKRVNWCIEIAKNLKKFSSKPKLIKLVSKLLGSETIEQIICQTHYKIPQDGVKYPWHQDTQKDKGGWKDKNGKGSFVLAMIAIDDCNKKNGAVKVIPKSHTYGRLNIETDKFEEDNHKKILPLINKHGIEYIEMNSGSVALMGPYTIHSSEENLSQHSRRMFMSGYIFPGSQIREKKNKTNYRTLSI